MMNGCMSAGNYRHVLLCCLAMKKKTMKVPELEVMSNCDGAWYDLDGPNTRVQGSRLRVRFW